MLHFGRGRRFLTRNLGGFDPNFELVSNGTFDADVSGWSVKFNGTVTWSSGALRVTADGGPASPRAACTLTNLFVSGTYQVVFSVTGQSASGFLNTESFVTTSSTGGTGGKVAGSATNTTLRTDGFQFVASTTTLYLCLMHAVTTAGTWTEFDNVSVKRIA